MRDFVGDMARPKVQNYTDLQGQPLYKNAAAQAITQTTFTAALNNEQTRGFIDETTGTQYFVDPTSNYAVTVEADGKAAIVAFDSTQDSMHYFGSMIDQYGRSNGKAPNIVQGGIEALAVAIVKSGSTWGKLKHVAGKAGKFLGKVSKVLGPLGVIAATAEANTLEAKAGSFVEYGLLSEEVMFEYDAILASFITQATVDPSLVGGEAAIQVVFDEWADKYEIPIYMRKELEPGLLLNAIFGAGSGYNGPIPEKDPYDVSMPQDNTHVDIVLPVEIQNSTDQTIDACEARRLLQSCCPGDVRHYSPELQSLYEFRSNECLFNDQWQQITQCDGTQHTLTQELNKLKESQDKRPAYAHNSHRARTPRNNTPTSQKL